jgi:hypothetical protein
MADGPVDINVQTKKKQKDEELKLTLHSLFIMVCESQSRMHMRCEDLVSDVANLQAEVSNMIGILYEAYPELMPDEEEEIE